MADKVALSKWEKAMRVDLKKRLTAEDSAEKLNDFKEMLVAARSMVTVFNQTIETVREFRPAAVEGVEKIVLRDTSKSAESKKLSEEDRLKKLLG